MIAIVDYGVGNLFSLRSSLHKIGAKTLITGDPAELSRASHVILPGVGAFGDAAQKLRDSGMWQPVRDTVTRGVPLLGICLGMQLLFDESDEFGTHAGLGLLRGRIAPLRPVLPADWKVPHMGWNALRLRRPDHPLVRNTKDGDCFYFVHSFYATACDADTVADAEYGVAVPAIVARGTVMGCQFHPEKSGDCGLALLRAFCNRAE